MKKLWLKRLWWKLLFILTWGTCPKCGSKDLGSIGYSNWTIGRRCLNCTWIEE